MRRKWFRVFHLLITQSLFFLFFSYIGSARFLSPPKGACMLGTRLYNTGSQFWVDHCTRCTCDNSVITCSKETCPVLECPREHQMTLSGRCCPQCPLVEESKASCSYGGRTYKASITLLFVVVQFYPPRAGNAITATRAKRKIELNNYRGVLKISLCNIEF